MKKLLSLVSVSAFLIGAAACSSSDDDDDDSSSGGNGNSSSGSTADGGSSSGSGNGSSGTTSSSSSSGNTSSSSSSSGGSSGGTGCGALVPLGAAVHPAAVDDDAPAPAGGAIAAGTYNLTAVNVYHGSDQVALASIKVTITLDGTNYTRAFTGGALTQTATGADSGTYSVVANAVVATQTCESGDENDGFGSVAGDFTSADGVLHLFRIPQAPIDGDKIEFVLTKQP